MARAEKGSRQGARARYVLASVLLLLLSSSSLSLFPHHEPAVRWLDHTRTHALTLLLVQGQALVPSLGPGQAMPYSVAKVRL